MTAPIHPARSKEGLRQGFIARIVFLLIALVVGLYFEVPIIFGVLRSQSCVQTDYTEEARAVFGPRLRTVGGRVMYVSLGIL